MESKITGGPTRVLFSGTILNKYDVRYFQCEETGFIQTSEPVWLDEAYSSTITKLDIGLPQRNEFLRNKLIPILHRHFDVSKRFLDYAGGYGLFTRMMRDKGLHFYHTDIYCQNLFAEYFDLNDCPQKSGFEVVTAFEVFEHMTDPMAELETLFKLGDNFFFTTVLVPEKTPANTSDWWYFAPETGQHVAFHTKASLQYIANKFGFNFYTDGYETHLFTKKKLQGNPLAPLKLPFLIRTMKRKVDRYLRKLSPEGSLLQQDFEFIKTKL